MSTHMAFNRFTGRTIACAALAMGLAACNQDTLLVAPRVAGLAARYRGRDRGGEAWRDWWSAGDTLPIAVELRLLAPPGGTLQPVLREALVVRLAWEGTP